MIFCFDPNVDEFINIPVLNICRLDMSEYTNFGRIVKVQSEQEKKEQAANTSDFRKGPNY